MNKNSLEKNKGQVIILNVLLFFAISVMIMFGVMMPVLSSYSTTKSLLASKKSFMLANSASEEAMYRMRNDFTFANDTDFYLMQGTSTIDVSNTSEGKQIDVVSNSDSYLRKLQIKAITGVGANFNYGIQVGNGGFNLENNATVVGNVYANGPVTGTNGAVITGSVVSAPTVPETIDQSNEISGTSIHEIKFSISSVPDLSQSFTSGTTSKVGKVSFYIKKTGSPNDATVRIHTDNNNSPSATILGTGVLKSSHVTSNYGWVSVVFPNPISVTSNTKYWITIDKSVENNKSYTIGAHDAYPQGKLKFGTYNSSWNDVSPAGIDSGFRVFVGTNDSKISGLVIGQDSEDIAWANIINNSVVSGNIYCQSGSDNGSKVCDTSRSDPSTLPMPLSESNINQFISEAEEGNLISGNFIASSTTYLGPAKITGDLTVNGTLILTGTVYVEGNLVTGNGSIVRLSPNYGNFSGVLVVNGNANLSNNVNFSGSGSTGSYILLVSTSDCPYGTGCSGVNAINVSNNVGTVILNAQDGKINFSNNAGAKSATAKMINLSNNVTITYDSGLADLNFSSGPSGGWNISSWQEVE